MNKYLQKLIELPENIYYDIKFLIIDVTFGIKYTFQRLTRGYDDTWYCDMAGHITKISLDCLKYYKKNKDGYPGEFNNWEEWEKILDSMIEGFEASQKIDKLDMIDITSDEFIDEYERLMKIRKKGLALFIKHYDSLWT